jgi:hypothetical protein
MQLDAEQLADLIAAGIQAAVGPLLARLAVLEARPMVAGPAGPPGRDGLNGKDGTNGRDGRDGKDGLNGKDGADGLNGKDGASGRDGKDGADGLNGKDGASGRDGKDGADGLNGKDGAPGLNGKDGTLEGLRVEWTDDRTLRFVRADGAVIPGSERRFPIVLYRGIYDAARTYEEGDQVTCQGSTWIAKQATTQRPDDDGPGAREWMLCSKRGAVGPRGPEGKPGPSGKDGAPGRDLTQMDHTGKKWS